MLCKLTSAAAKSPYLADDLKAAVQAVNLLPVVADWTASGWEKGVFWDILSGGAPATFGKALLDKVLSPVVHEFITTNTGSFVADYILQTVPGFSRTVALLFTPGSGVNLGDVVDYLDPEILQAVLDAIAAELARPEGRLTMEDVTRDGLTLLHDIVRVASLALESDVDAIRATLGISDADVLVLKPILDIVGQMLDWVVRAIHEPFGLQDVRFQDIFRVKSANATVYGGFLDINGSRRRLQQYPTDEPATSTLPVNGDASVEEVLWGIGGAVGWLAQQWSTAVEPVLNTLFYTKGDTRARQEAAGTVAVALNGMKFVLMQSYLGVWLFGPLQDEGTIRFTDEFTANVVLDAVMEMELDPDHTVAVMIDTFSTVASSNVVASVPIEVYVYQGYIFMMTLASMASSLSDTQPTEPPPTPPGNYTNGTQSQSCSVCQSCIATLVPLLRNSTLTTADRSAALLSYCQQYSGLYNVPAEACNDVTASAKSLLAMGSNPRVGFLCSRIGLCPSFGCPNLTSVRSNGYGWISGPLDLCTAEGVAGGTSTLFPNTTMVGSCRSNSDCGQGYPCELGHWGGRTCGCQSGVDVCTTFGMCETYCSKNTTSFELAQRNAGVITCNPLYSSCPMGYECAQLANCTFWACNATNETLYQQSCSGLCMRVQPTVREAWLISAARSIDVVLSARAEPFSSQPCSTVFDAATVVLLGGAACSCSANNSELVINYGPNATIQANQMLTLLSNGSALREYYSYDSVNQTFSGSVAVKLPSPPPWPGNFTSANDSCSLCSSCLVTMVPLVLNTTRTAVDRSAALLSFCHLYGGLYNVTAEACNNVTALVKSLLSTGLRPRVGYICSRMSLCPTSGCVNLTSIHISGTYRLSGPFDLCTAEGVASGTSTLPGNWTSTSSCSSNSDCGQGLSCDFTRYGGRTCGCQSGVDVCTDHGMCETYCAKNTTRAELGQRNTDVLTCNPAAYSYCPYGYNCTQLSTCTYWGCSDTNQTLYPQSCAGMCLPVQPYMRDAWLNNATRAINVTLSFPAAPFSSKPCSAVFDAATVVLLGGAACSCSANDSRLLVSLGPNATVQGYSMLTLRNGTTLVDKFGGNRTFSGSVYVWVLYIPPFIPWPAANFTNSNDSCSVCQGCLLTLVPLIFNPMLDITNRSASLLMICQEYGGRYNLTKEACGLIVNATMDSMYRGGPRMGYLCSRMGMCPASGCPNVTSVLASGAYFRPYPISGPLDLCTIEGVAGGTPTAPAIAPIPWGSCRSDLNCTSGQTCDFSAYTYRSCECQAGLDVCTTYGSCRYFCSMSSTQMNVTQRNGGASMTCNPDSAQPYCPTGYACTKVSNCLFWACDEARMSLYQQSCSGLCMRLPPTMRTAVLSYARRSIDVTLSAPAASFLVRPCSTVFDPATVVLLGGADCSCSAQYSHLLINLGPNSTVTVNQSLTLLSNKTALMEAYYPSRPFSGSVVVTTQHISPGDQPGCTDIDPLSPVQAILCSLASASGTLPGIEKGLAAGVRAVSFLPSITEWSRYHWRAESFSDIINDMPASLGNALLDNALSPVVRQFVTTRTGSFLTDCMLGSVPGFARMLALLETPGSGVDLRDVVGFTMNTETVQIVVDAVLAELANPNGRLTIEDVAKDGLLSLHAFIMRAAAALESEGDTIRVALRVNEADMGILKPFLESVGEFLDWVLRVIHGAPVDGDWPSTERLAVSVFDGAAHRRRLQQSASIYPLDPTAPSAAGVSPERVVGVFRDVVGWLAMKWGIAVEPVLGVLLDENAGFKSRQEAAGAVASALNAVVDALSSTYTGDKLVDMLYEEGILSDGGVFTTQDVLMAASELQNDPGHAVAVVVEKAAMLLSSGIVTSVPAGVVIRDGVTLLEALAKAVINAGAANGTDKPTPPPYNDEKCLACQSCLTAMAVLNRPISLDITLGQLAGAVTSFCLASQPYIMQSCGDIATTALNEGYSGVVRVGYLCSTLGQCPTTGCSSLTAPRADGSGPVTGTLDWCTAEGVVGGTRRWNPAVVPCNVSAKQSTCPAGYACTPAPDCHYYWGCNIPNTTISSAQHCDGLCLRSQPVMKEAWLANETRTINVTLSAPAVPISNQPCRALFDAPTMALLGASLCSANGSTLYINLATDATIKANDVLTLLSNGTALVDKFSNMSFFGSVVVRVSPINPWPPGNYNNSTSNHTCSVCQGCLVTLVPLMYNMTLSSSNRSNALADYCQLYGAPYGVSSQACSSIAEAAIASFSFGSPRIGYICAKMGLCPTSGCPNLTSVYPSGTSTISGALDLCTREGVVGGTPTLPLITPPVTGSCLSDSSCAQGNTCDFTMLGGRTCQCVLGEDVCTDVGMCMNFCAKHTTVMELGEVNSGVITCNATSSQCPTGYTCAQIANCTYWACDSANQSLYRKSCSGLCMPSELKMTEAWFTNDGQAISVLLSTTAEPFSLKPCSAVFDAATVAFLGGAGSRCSVEDQFLLIIPTPAATIQVNQTLTLLATGTALVSSLDNFRAFSGSVVVESCKPCSAPNVKIVYPTVIAAPCTGGTSSSTAVSSSVEFDASLSADPSGRALAGVTWSVIAAPGGISPGREVLDAAVRRTNALASIRERLLLLLNASEVAKMEDWNEYTLEVTVRSWLGTVGSSQAIFDKISAAAAPAIRLVGPDVQNFQIRTGIRVSAVATTACPGRTLVWKWTQVNPSSVQVLPEGGVADQNLYVKGPIPIKHNQNITLRVYAWYANRTSDGSSSEVYADVTLIAKGSPPVARLSGPSGDVMDNTTLVFNATGSFDPDNPGAPQSLVFTWECSREDGDPCFTSSQRGNQTATPGIWTLPPGLLEIEKWYTFTVTVTTSAGLDSSASVQIRPRTAVEPFPKGKLSRACSAVSCMAPHSTDDPLVVALLLESGSRSATVSWQCEDIPTLGAVVGPETAQQAASAVRTLTIPAALLPTNLPSITIMASMTLGDVAGVASLTVSLNSAPSCGTNSSSPVECITVEVQNGTVPDALVVVRASGWKDDQDSQLRYEFGFRVSDSAGAQMRERGTATSAKIRGLPDGDVEVYGCAIDSQNARTCAGLTIKINPMPDDYDARGALQSFDAASLVQDNNILEMMDWLGSILDGMSSSNTMTNANDAALVAKVSNEIVGAAVLSLANETDIEQVFKTVASVAYFATSAASMLSDASRSVFGDVAEIAVNALTKSTSVGDLQDSLNQICRLLGLSLPQSSGTTSTANPSSKVSIADRETSAVVAASAITDARDSLLQITRLGHQLGVALGQQATPGVGYLSAGDQGVYVAAAIMSSSAAELGTGQAQLAAGPTAGSSASSGGNSAKLAAGADALNVGGRRQLRSLESLTSARYTRRLAATAVSGDAEAQLIVNGAAATAASGYTIVLTQASSSNAAVSVATTGLLKTTWTVLGGLATVSWNAPATSTGAAPVLGGDSYILLTLPAPSYNPARSTSCLLYDISAGTVTEQSGSFVSYNASSTRVTCRVTVLGSYFLAQGALLPTPSPPPTTTKVVSITMLIKLSSASKLATKEQWDTFRSGLQAALASIYQITSAEVNINTSDVRSDSTVQVQAELTVPASRADDGGPVAGFMTDPKSKLPSDFISQFGIVEVTVKQGKQTFAVQPSDDDDVNVGAIVGGVVGGTVGLLLLVVIVLLLVVRRRKQQAVQPVVLTERSGPSEPAPRAPAPSAPSGRSAVPPGNSLDDPYQTPVIVVRPYSRGG